MSRIRYVLVHLVILGLIAPGLLAIVLDRETWPFHNYRMYRNARTHYTLTVTRLYGVTPDGTEYAVNRNAELAPLDKSRIRTCFARMRKKPDAEQLLERALTDVLKRYELWRVQGAHDGPQLVGIRLYQVRWDMEPGLVVETPAERILLASHMPEGS